MENKLDFIGLGGKKCATSWLFQCLRIHSNIFIPEEKELNIFSYKYDNFKSEVNNYFNTKNNIILGDISPSYLINPDVPLRIYNHNPNIKLLIIVRNPTDRAISHYKMMLGKENIDSNENILSIFNRNRDSIRNRGKYCYQIQRYLNYFKREQIKIIMFDDIRLNPRKVLSEIFNFIGVDDKFNVSNKIIHRKYQSYDFPVEITMKEKKYISNYYEESINNLSKFLNVNLTKWKY